MKFYVQAMVSCSRHDCRAAAAATVEIIGHYGAILSNFGPGTAGWTATRWDWRCDVMHQWALCPNHRDTERANLARDEDLDIIEGQV